MKVMTCVSCVQNSGYIQERESNEWYLLTLFAMSERGEGSDEEEEGEREREGGGRGESTREREREREREK